MCLHIANFAVKHIARKDKVVYKAIHNNRWTEPGEYLTPFEGVLVKLGETYRSTLVKENQGANNILFADYVINYGLHSFKSPKHAREISTNKNYFVVRCLIPKGSYYYKGCYNIEHMLRMQ
jgi:hypothetical protein